MCRRRPGIAKPRCFSILTPASRITGAHFAISSLMNLAVTSGVVSVVGTAAMSSRNLIVAGSFIIWRDA